MFKLVISDDEGKQTTVPLVRDEITIGRKEGNTIRLTERNVSRRHARLQKQEGNYLLQDLGSYNGVVINGQRLLDSQSLKNGDQIMIGDYKLAIMEEATAQMHAPPPGANGHDTIESIPVSVPPPVPAMAAPPPPPPPQAAAAPAPSSAPPIPPPNASSEAIPDEVRSMRLVFLAPSGAPSPVKLERLPLILGRSEAADISLPFSSISREHARLSMQGGSLVIEDLGSSNGVAVNGNKAPRSVLSPGDHVTLGVVEFRVARRGDSTVVMNVPDSLREDSSKKKSPLGLVLALVGVGVVGTGVVLMLRGNNTTAATTNVASAPELGTTAPAPNTTGAPTTAAPVPAGPTPAAPVAVAPAVAPAPAAVQPAPEPVIAPAPAPPVVAVAPVEPAPAPYVAPPAAAAHAPEHASSHTSHSTNVAVAAPAPAPHPTPLPVVAVAPTPAPTPVHTAPPPNPNPTVAATSTGGTSAGTSDAQSPLDAARTCRGDNACVVAALEGRARSEPEFAMLAVTYRVMGNRAQAVRTMQRYLQRWPGGPRAEGFHNYIEAE